jgi:hypothetical protein
MAHRINTLCIDLTFYASHLFDCVDVRQKIADDTAVNIWQTFDAMINEPIYDATWYILYADGFKSNCLKCYATV